MTIALPLVGCTADDDNINDNYQEGTPTLVSAAAGNERVQVTWNPNDTNVEGSYIFWNNGDNSEYIYFTPGTEEVSTIITIAADTYDFYVQNVLEDGELSTKSGTLTIKVYDSSDIAGYEICPIMSVNYDGELGGMITWDDSDDCAGNMVYYVDDEGNEYQRYCPIEEGTSYLEEAGLNTSFTYVSYYIPVEGGIDNLATEPSDGSDVFDATTDGFVVKSIDAFAYYFSRDNVHVKLAEGTYSFGPADVRANLDLYGSLNSVNSYTIVHSALCITASNSTYDFGGATIEFDNNVANALDYMFYYVHILGNNNTLKNGTLECVGEYETYPVNAAVFFVMDGISNTAQDLIMKPKGSYPWGYGEVFGKGSGNVIYCYKTGGLLIRGESNIVDGCEVYQSAFCHGIFMQGAYNPVIKNCHVEGMMITTDEILDDKRSKDDPGSNGLSRAIDVDFLSNFWDGSVCPYSNYNECDTYCNVGNAHNYTVPSGFVISLMEEGIRAYNNASTIINGVYYEDGEHNTQNITVQNCSLRCVRGGIATSLQSGWTAVDDCVLVGCEKGIAVGNGGDYVKNCYVDFKYGIAFNVDYATANKQDIDITLTDNNLPDRINGYKAENTVGYTHVTETGGYTWPNETTQRSWATRIGVDFDDCVTYQPEGTKGKVRNIAHLRGYNNSFTFRADFDDAYYAANGEYIIQAGGDEMTVDALHYDEKNTLTTTTINNYTKFRVVLDDDSSSCIVNSIGPVEDYGTGNTINYITTAP